MMGDVKKICLIVDLEGFHIAARKSKLYSVVVHEMGQCAWPGSDAFCGTFHYFPTDKYRDLHLRDRRSVKYVMDHIHGLSYHPTCEEQVRPPWQLYEDIEDLYNTHKTSDRVLVGCKGGRVEMEILSKMGIPSVNLEHLGCPKFDTMTRLATMGSCGHHAKPLCHHCPQVECYHFMQWLRKTLKLPRDCNFVNIERALRLAGNNTV